MERRRKRETKQGELQLEDLSGLFLLSGDFDPFKDEEVAVPACTKALLRYGFLKAPFAQGCDFQFHTYGQGSLYRLKDNSFEKWVKSEKEPLTTRESVSHTPTISPENLNHAERIATVCSSPRTLGSPPETLVVTASEKPSVYLVPDHLKKQEGLLISEGAITKVIRHLTYDRTSLLIEYWQRLQLGDDFYTKTIELISPITPLGELLLFFSTRRKPPCTIWCGAG